MGLVGLGDGVDPRGQAERGELATFESVQERLVNGLLLWRRAPDRERGWQAVRSLWPDTKESEHWSIALGGELSSLPQDKPEPRRSALTRDEVTEMELVGEWLQLVPEQDRKLVVYALAALASGRARIPWLRLRRPLGVKLGADGLRKRYGAAITGICAALNSR